MPLDHKDMPQVGYYHLEIIQKYLKFFKKDVFLKLILTPPLFSSSFSSGLVFPVGLNPLPPLSPKGKRKELEVFPYGPLARNNK